jgi:ParB/RepB/Spo0J family partition protein
MAKETQVNDRKSKQITNKPLAAPATARESIHIFPIAQIVPSDSEPQILRRGQYDDESITGLGQSIKTQGQISPIVVRMIGKDLYQIIVGERRWRGSERVGLTTIECIIRQLTDAEVLEIQYQENHKREDNNPMIDAFYFKHLKEKEGYSVHALADRFGIPEKEVTEKLKLNDLIPEAVRQLLAGHLKLRHAYHLAKYPDQAQALIVTENYAYKNGRPGDGALPYAEFKQLIGTNVVRRLSDAPFDTEDPALHESVKGLKCSDCTERSGYAPMLFPDLAKNDSCLNKPCFDFKTNVSLRLELDAIALSKPNPEQKPLKELRKEVTIVTEKSFVPADKNPFTQKALLNQNQFEEPECEFSELSLGLDRAKRVYICKSPKCEIHHPARKPSIPAGMDGRQKLEQNFNENVRRIVREKIFIQAIEVFDDYKPVWMFDDVVQMVVYDLFISAGYDVRNFILKICADYDLPKNFMDMETIKAAIAKLTRAQQSRLIFLLVACKEIFAFAYSRGEFLARIAPDSRRSGKAGTCAGRIQGNRRKPSERARRRQGKLDTALLVKRGRYRKRRTRDRRLTNF